MAKAKSAKKAKTKVADLKPKKDPKGGISTIKRLR
jgi:hypothetical protein